MAKTAPKKIAARTARKSSAQPAPPDLAAEVTGSEQDYQRFLGEAEKIETRDIVAFKGDASLAYHNVAEGLAAIRPFHSRIHVELPLVKLAEIEGLGELALGVCFAVKQAEHGGGTSPGTTRVLVHEGGRLRKLLLLGLTTAAEAGLVPATIIGQMHHGHGPIDFANDCVTLASLYRKYAGVLKGKTPVVAKDIQAAAEVGTQLLAVLRPQSAKRSRAAVGDVKQAMDRRDRMWTLLVERYDMLRRIGIWFLGERHIDASVPPLQSRVASTKKAKAPRSVDQPKAPVGS